MGEDAVATRPAPDSFHAQQRQLALRLKEVGRDDDAIRSELTSIAEKCGYDMAMEEWVPAGGALSFADYDAFIQAANQEAAIREQTYRYQDIVGNILKSDMLSMDQKLSRVEQATRDLRQRLGLLDTPDAVAAVVTGAKEDWRRELVADAQKPGFLARAVARFKGTAAEPPSVASDPASASTPPAVPDRGKEFLSFKDRNGDWRWLAVFSNELIDDTQERFPGSAHERFEQWVDETKEYPVLRLWHVPGADVGTADMVTHTSEGYMLATGTYDPGLEFVAEKLKEMGPQGVSHGFKYDENQLVDGEYGHYRTFEISILPLAAAANKETAFFTERLDMSIKEAKKGYLTEILGPELTAALESTLAKAATAAGEKGIGLKEILEAVKDSDGKAPTATEATPAATAAAGGAAADGGGPVTLAEVAAFVKEAIVPLAEQLSAATKEITALRESDDEKIAARFRPRGGPIAAGFAASTSDDTAIRGNAKEAKEAAEGLSTKEGLFADAPEHLRDHLAMMGSVLTPAR